MKNLHLLPTDKASRLCINGKNQMHIYITSNEEIKQGDWHILKDGDYKGELRRLISKPINSYISAKIILTTDTDLIKDGVQAIDDEFLEWFINNPSCESVEVDKNWNYPLDKSWEYKIIIPKEEPNPFELPKALPDDVFYQSLEEPKQETLEETALRLFPKIISDPYNPMEDDNKEDRDTWLKGAKWQQERMYSEEETIQLLIKFNQEIQEVEDVKEWFEQFKKK
jgi:hypothetical protein